MKKSKKIYTLSHIVFTCLFIFCSLTMGSNKLSGYFGTISTRFLILKFVLVFTIVAVAVITETYITRSIEYIAKSAPIIMLATSILFIFDYFVTEISGTGFIYKAFWAAYIFSSQMSLLIFTSIMTKKLKLANFNEFYSKFILSFTPLFVFTFILAFAREPSLTGMSTYNLIPFCGTFKLLKAIFEYARTDIEIYFIFFGNILYFIPYGLLVPYYLKQSKPYIHILIGCLTPIIIEFYQFIFHCGDSDIDDIILNISGFFIGYLFSRAIVKNLINTKGQNNEKKNIS